MPSPIPPRHGMEAQSNASRTSALRQEQGNKAARHWHMPNHVPATEAEIPPFTAHPCTACPPRTPWRLRIDVQVEGKMCGHRRIRQGWISSLRCLHPSIHLDTSSEHDRRHAGCEDGARIVAGDAAVGTADVAGVIGQLVQRGRIGRNADLGQGERGTD